MICYAVPFWLILLCALLYIIGCLGTWAHAMDAAEAAGDRFDQDDWMVVLIWPLAVPAGVLLVLRDRWRSR